MDVHAVNCKSVSFILCSFETGQMDLHMISLVNRDSFRIDMAADHSCVNGYVITVTFDSFLTG